MKGKKYWTIATIIFLCLKINTTFSQESFLIVKGFIYDKDRKPIESVNVRVNNTAIFQITDSTGAFSLKIPSNVLSREIYFSRVGFVTRKLIIDTRFQAVEVILESSTDLEEATIIGQRSAYWKRKLKILTEVMFGRTPYSKSCKFLDDNNLIIKPLEKNGMEVSFKNFCQFVNNDLGYIVTIDFDKISIMENNNVNMTVKSNIFFYEELKPKNDKELKQWKKNRQQAFENSFRGFLVNMINRDTKNYYILQQNTFKNYNYGYFNYPKNSNLTNEIDEKRLIKPPIDSLYYFDKSKNHYYLKLEKPLMIVLLKNYTQPGSNIFNEMNNEVSYISASKDMYAFNQYGWSIKKNMNSSIGGFWGSHDSSLSAYLPQDYLPEKYLK